MSEVADFDDIAFDICDACGELQIECVCDEETGA